MFCSILLHCHFSSYPKPCIYKFPVPQELIWIHQEEWQQKENTITLVDATYKQPSVTSHCFCHCLNKRSTKHLQTMEPRSEVSILSLWLFWGWDIFHSALCDFHLGEKLNKQQQEQPLALLRVCAWAPSAVDTSTLGVDTYVLYTWL